MSLTEYIRDAYPSGIRGEAFDESSITHKYDVVRSNLFDFLEADILKSSINLTITNSDETGISEMEGFLGIENTGNRTLEERRAEILAGLYDGKSTVSAIKKLIYNTVGGDADSVELIEAWQEGAENKLGYRVVVQLGKVTEQFRPDILEQILNKIHPFHCTVVVETESKVEDAIGIGDSVQYGLHSPMIWGEESDPRSTDTVWVVGDNILEGNFWN